MASQHDDRSGHFARVPNDLDPREPLTKQDHRRVEGSRAKPAPRRCVRAPGRPSLRNVDDVQLEPGLPGEPSALPEGAHGALREVDAHQDARPPPLRCLHDLNLPLNLLRDTTELTSAISAPNTK